MARPPPLPCEPKAGATGSFSNSGTLSAGTGAALASNGVTLTNTGAITGTGGTAVSLTGSGDTLILGTGSVLSGNVTSTGANNALTLQGSGSSGSNFSGFNSLVMSGTAWTLGGVVSTTGTSQTATNVQSGTLVLTGTLTNGGNGGGTTLAPGATLQVGNGGATGQVSSGILDNGTLTFLRSDAGSSPFTIAGSVSGSGVIDLKGVGIGNQSSYQTNIATDSAFVGTAIVGVRRAAGVHRDESEHHVCRDGSNRWRSVVGDECHLQQSAIPGRARLARGRYQSIGCAQSGGRRHGERSGHADRQRAHHEKCLASQWTRASATSWILA